MCSTRCPYITAKNTCSVCLREPYCSSDCQKADRKDHKPICKVLKKLSNALQPYNDVAEVSTKILYEEPPKFRNNVRVLMHLLSYTEFQFGNHIPCKTYREREPDSQIANWRVEIEFSHQNSNLLISIISEDKSHSVLIRDNMMMPYLKKQSENLKPYSTLFELGDATFINQLGRSPAMCVLAILKQTVAYHSYTQIGIILIWQTFMPNDLLLNEGKYHVSRLHKLL
jgi:hypothetical protein